MAAKTSSSLDHFMETFDAAVLADGKGRVLECRDNSSRGLFHPLGPGQRLEDLLPGLAMDVASLVKAYPPNTPHHILLGDNGPVVLQIVSNLRKTPRDSRYLLLLNEAAAPDQAPGPAEFRALRDPGLSACPGEILEALLRSAPGMVLLLDGDRRVLGVNMGAYAAFGYPYNELLNADCRKLLDAGVNRGFDKALRAANGNGAWQGELTARRLDGTAFPVEAAVHRVEQPDEAACLVALLDTSREKALQHLVEEERDKVREMSITLKTLISAVEQEKAAKSRLAGELLPALKRLAGEPRERQRLRFVEDILRQLGGISEDAPGRTGGGMLQLTPTEQEICRLIRARTPTKRIAEMLHSSLETVQTHRKHIRGKLGLKGKKVSLYSYLITPRQPA